MRCTCIDAGQDFELAEVEVGGLADSGENGLHLAGGAVHLDAGSTRALMTASI